MSDFTDAADAGESDEPPVKPARRGLFGRRTRYSSKPLTVGCSL